MSTGATMDRSPMKIPYRLGFKNAVTVVSGRLVGTYTMRRGRLPMSEAHWTWCTPGYRQPLA